MLALRNSIRLCVILALFAAPAAAPAADVVVGPGDTPAFSLDQPRLHAVLFDGGVVITDTDDAGDVKPVVFDAFIDTGASGTVISNLHVTGYIPTLLRGEILSLGLDGTPAGEFIGAFILVVTHMALDPVPAHRMALFGLLQPLPQLDILHRLASGGAPAILLPALDPAGDAAAQIAGVGRKVDLGRPLQRL